MTARALGAELFGSFALVAAICGSTMLAGPAGGGPLVVALAAGLAMTAMGYAVGHVSGGHFNPAVTIGLITAGRFDAGNLIGYILVQVIGGLAAAFLFTVILAGALAPGPGATTRWADLVAVSNSYGGARGFTMTAAIITEVMATALLVIVFVGAKSPRGSASLAPLAIGAALGLLYLVAQPVTNASLNPARSTATAVLAGGNPLAQLWVFWVAPIAGGILGGAIGKWLDEA